jgi:hypothetical protein
MSNIIVDYSGGICLCNFDQCLSKTHGIVRVGRDHYKYSAPEIMTKPEQSIYEMIEYRMNVDCFSVGMMTWELINGIHAFADIEKDSNSPVADLIILYYIILYCNRKMLKLSQLWLDLSEGDSKSNIMKNITTIMNVKLESTSNVLYSLSYYIALLLRDVHNRLSVEQILREFREEDNAGRRRL